jgi:hypothetical protein
MKNAGVWNVTPCGLVRTGISVERIFSIIMVTRIDDLGIKLAVTRNRSTQNASVAIYC